MSNDKSLDTVTRREFAALIPHLLRGVVTTCGYAIADSVLASFQSKRIKQRIQDFEEESEKELAKGNLRVKYFAKDINDVISQISPYNTKLLTYTKIGGWFIGDAVGGYLLRNYSNLTNRKIGVISAIIDRILDIGSTYLGVKLMQDPRFQEYGLDNYYTERNPIVGINPSRRDLFLKGGIFSILFPIFAWYFPFVGRAHMGTSPSVVANNYQFTKELAYSLELGDKVKSMINDGKGKEEIQYSLNNIQSSFKI